MTPFSSGLVVVGEFIEVGSDDFNRANSATVGNGWVDPEGVGGPWEISSNRLMRNDAVGTVSNQNLIYRDGNIVDQFMEGIPWNEGIGPAVRLAGPPGGYLLCGQGPDLKILRSSITGWTDLGAPAAALGEAPNYSTDVLYIEITDTGIKGFKNGIELISFADSMWLQGHRGVAVASATGDLRFDNARWGE